MQANLVSTRRISCTIARLNAAEFSKYFSKTTDDTRNSLWKCFLQSKCTFKNVVFFTVVFQECLKILRKFFCIEYEFWRKKCVSISVMENERLKNWSVDYTGRYICLKFDILHRVTNWFSLVLPKTQTYAHWTDYDLFNLPEAFYNKRNFLGEVGRVRVHMDNHAWFTASFGWCRSQRVKWHLLFDCDIILPYKGKRTRKLCEYYTADCHITP